jgi:nucleotide-binding universal stress UspA family protein
MKKILVPVDGSESSKNAAVQALSLARMYNSDVTFLTIVQIDGDLFYGDMGTMINVDYINLSDVLI